jgi:hypothetical protein
MSDSKKVVVASGMVQQFGKDAEIVTEKDVNGQTVREFTIKTASQKLIRISVWDRHDDFEVDQGDSVWVEGSYSEFDGKNGNTLRSISAYDLTITPKVGKQEREVVNTKRKPKADNDTDEESF